MAVRINAEPERRDENLILWLFVVFFFLHVAIPGQVLDLFEHYTSLGGHAYEKLHPGALGMLLLSWIVLYSQNFPVQADDKKIVGACWWYIFAIFTVAAFGILQGRSEGFSYLFDTMLVGPFACLLMLRISDPGRVLILKIFIYFMILNTCVVFVEYLTHWRLFPFTQELFWRPTAFLGHPLNVGVITVTTMPFVWLMRWSTLKRLLVMLFFLVGTYASQARMASLFGTLCALGCVWIHLVRSTQRGKIDEGTMLTAGATAFGGIVFVAFIIVVSGLADRFLHYGAFTDQSAQARIQIYRIFRYMTWDQILYGLPRWWTDYLVHTVLKLEASESAIVNFIAQFGLIFGSVLMTGLLYFFWVLSSNGRNIYVAFGVITFLAVGLTSNQFTSKSPVFPIVAVLVTAARAAGRQTVWLTAPQWSVPDKRPQRVSSPET